MSDIRKILNTLTEMTSGSVASVSMPLTTQRRQDHVDENDAKSQSHDVLEYGNWENSALTTSKKLKQTRSKAKKLVKKIYGEDTTTESMDGVSPSTKMFTSEGKTKNPVAKAAQRVAKGSGKHKNPAKVLPRKAKHKKMYEEEITEQDLIISPVIRRGRDRDLISRDHSRIDREVEMARGDVHQAQQNAAKILAMIQDRSEQEGLEGWVQEKIIKASDYLNTVREYLENKGQEQGVAEGSLNEEAGNMVVRQLITDFNKQMSGSPYYPLDYKDVGMRSWTRGDRSRYKDPGYIYIDKEMNPQDIEKYLAQKPIEKFWDFLSTKGAKKIGDVSGEFGSDPHSPAVVLGKLIFVYNGKNISWGSTSRLKNSSVWRQKQQQGVAEGLSDPTRKVFFKVIKTQGTGMPSGYRRVKTITPLEDGGFYIELSTPGYGMNYTRHNYKNFSLTDGQGKPITGQEAYDIINGQQDVAEGSDQELVRRQLLYWDQVAKEKKEQERKARMAKKAEYEKTPAGKAEKYWSQKGVAEGSDHDDDYSTASFEKWKKQKEYEKEYDKKKPAKPIVPDNKDKKKGVEEGLTKRARAKKEAESVKAVIARLEQELKDTNPHIDKDDIHRRLETEKRRLELYRDVLDDKDVTEGFSDVVKGIKRSIKGKEHPDVIASKHAGRAMGHYNQGDIPAGDKETERYVKTRDIHLKAKGVAEGLTEQVYKVLAVDKSNALSKQVKLKVKANSLDEVFERLAINDWYPLEINGVEVINGKRLKQGLEEGEDDDISWMTPQQQQEFRSAYAAIKQHPEIWKQYQHYTAQDLKKEFPNCPDQELKYLMSVIQHGLDSNDSNYLMGRGRAVRTILQWKQAGQKDVAEDLDANQRRVGQLGPTEKIGKRGTRGRLVGGN